MSTIAILTAGGTGTRTHQDLPKQFLNVENKPIIVYTLEAFQQHPSIDEIYVSCLDGWSAMYISIKVSMALLFNPFIILSSKQCFKDFNILHGSYFYIFFRTF